jgi:hypothetical protein
MSYIVEHIFEDVDDYGQPCSRSEVVEHSNYELALQDVANSTADFGARILQPDSVRTKLYIPYVYLNNEYTCADDSCF